MLNFLNPIIKETLLLGDKKFIGLVKSGNTPYRQLDIRNFTEEQWPFGLLYNSSGKEFNILLRERADKLGYKLDEYSLFNRNTNTDVPAKTEQDIFRILGVKYLKPEQRLRTLAQLPIL